MTQSQSPVLPGSDATPEPTRGHRKALDRTVFGVAAALAVIFLIWGAVATDNFSTSTAAALDWITSNLGWLFVLASAGFVIFPVVLAVMVSMSG